MKQIVLIAVIATLFGLSACGRKAPLETPPPPQNQVAVAAS